MFSRFPFLLFLIFFFSFLFFFFLEDQLLLVWNPLFSQSWILLCDSLCEPPDPPPFLCFCLLPFKCKQWSPIFYFSLWSDLLVTCCNICSADYFSFPSFLVRTHFKMTSDLSIRDLSRRADCQANVSILCRSQVPHTELYLCWAPGWQPVSPTILSLSFYKNPCWGGTYLIFSSNIFASSFCCIFLNISGIHLKFFYFFSWTPVSLHTTHLSLLPCSWHSISDLWRCGKCVVPLIHTLPNNYKQCCIWNLHIISLVIYFKINIIYELVWNEGTL